MAQPPVPRPQGRLRLPGWASYIFPDSKPLFGRRQDSRPDAMRRNLLLLATAALGVVAAQEAGVAAPAQVRQSCNMAANTSPARARPPSRGTHSQAAMFHTWTPARRPLVPSMRATPGPLLSAGSHPHIVLLLCPQQTQMLRGIEAQAPADQVGLARFAPSHRVTSDPRQRD
jgi:hypothetical protein